MNINEGDKVIIVDTNDNKTEAILLHKPQGAGDLWGFKSRWTDVEFYLNPYSSRFHYFEKKYEDATDG